MIEKHSPMNVYKNLQNMVAEREPFNEDVINYRQREDIAYLISNICKGLEIIDGVEFVYSEINDGRSDIYENKKPKNKLTKEEEKELREINARSKGVYKCKNSHYQLTSIAQSRYLNIEFMMRYAHGERVEEVVYNLRYPELVNDDHFLLEGNRFYPIFQLADAEYYRLRRDAIVMKTTFMPVAVRGGKTSLSDYHKNINVTTRVFELSLFRKDINVLLYFFAKFGVNETLERFDINEHVEFVFQPIEEYENNDDSYLFRLTAGITLAVDNEWIDNDPNRSMSIIHTIVNLFNRKHINEDNFYDVDYWMRQLGREFTSNSNKAHEKAHSIIISVERLLDVTTKNSMRNPEEEKEDVFTAIVVMIKNFENILRIDNYDLANKRIRVAEYLLYPLTERLSRTVYRLISSRNPPISRLRQLFSSLDENFIIDRMSSISLIRFSNEVNTIDLFSRILKGSKAGPQSQSMDNSGSSMGVRGIDPSYLGRVCVTSTSSNDPGVSFTVTPFCEVYDPTDNNNFYFTKKSGIDDYRDGMIEEDDSLDVDTIITEDEIIDE